MFENSWDRSHRYKGRITAAIEVACPVFKNLLNANNSNAKNLRLRCINCVYGKTQALLEAQFNG